jgi:hypothetical protein
VPVILPAATITALTPPAAITGFATSAKQDTLDASVNSLLKPASTLAAVTAVTSITNPVAVTNAGITSIDGKVTACNTGAVVIASGACTVDLGANNDVTVTNATAANCKVEATIAAAQSVAVTNAGTFATQVDGSALTALQLIDDPVIADDAAFTPATSKVMMAGFEADESSTDSVDEGDAGAARMTLDRKQIVTLQPHTSGGLSIFTSIDLDESEEEIKATAGQIYGWYFMNLHTATLYLRFYNATAANTTVGTTTAIMVIPVPAGSAANVAFPNGIAFDTALSAAVTTGIAANDTGAPAANVFVCNVFYK